MLDLILVVDDAEVWHAENLKRNYHHYSYLKRFGTDVVTQIQRAGGGVYYNTLVKIDSQVIYMPTHNMSFSFMCMWVIRESVDSM